MPITPFTSPSDIAQAQLMILLEEFKTMREEIARFQNRQKDLVLLGVLAIAAAIVGAASKDQNAATLVNHPVMLLFGPLFLVPIAILFFEAKLAIFKAANFIGKDLRDRAGAVASGRDDLMRWEEYRTRVDRSNQFDHIRLSSEILFIWPSPALVMGFVLIQAFKFIENPASFRSSEPMETGASWVLFLLSTFLIWKSYDFRKKVDGYQKIFEANVAP